MSQYDAAAARARLERGMTAVEREVARRRRIALRSVPYRTVPVHWGDLPPFVRARARDKGIVPATFRPEVERALARRYLLQLHVVLYGVAACPLSEARSCVACRMARAGVESLEEAPRPSAGPTRGQGARRPSSRA